MSRNRLVITVLGALFLFIAVAAFVLNYVLLERRFQNNAERLGIEPTRTPIAAGDAPLASAYHLLAESAAVGLGSFEGDRAVTNPTPTPFAFTPGRCSPLMPLDDLAEMKAYRRYVLFRKGDRRPHTFEVTYEKAEGIPDIIERSRVLDADGKATPWQTRRYACDAEKRVWVFDEAGTPLGEYLSLKMDPSPGDATWVRGLPYFADAPAYCSVTEAGPLNENGRDFLYVVRFSCEENAATRILYFAPGVGVVGWKNEQEEVFLEGR